MKAEALVRVNRTPLTRDVFKPHAPLSERLEDVAALFALSSAERCTLERAVSRIDERKFHAILDQNRDRIAKFDGVNPIKYIDIVYWLAEATRICFSLGLNTTSSKCILDVGAGPGAFCAICACLNHQATAVDVEHSLYRDLCNLSGVNRFIAPVSDHRLHLPIEDKFDLITIFWPTFHRQSARSGIRTYWSNTEWIDFMKNLADQTLAPGGEVSMIMPFGAPGTATGHSPFVAYAQTIGATVVLAPDGKEGDYITFSRDAILKL